MLIHLDIVMTQSTKHSEVIIIGDKGKGMKVRQMGRSNRLYVSILKREYIYFIIFNFVIYFVSDMGSFRRAK